MPNLYKVDIKIGGGGNILFEPATLTVQAGDQINWTNYDSVSHLPGVVHNDGSCVGLIEKAVSGHGGVSDNFSPSRQYDPSGQVQLAYSFNYSCCDNRSIAGVINVEPSS